MRILKSAVVSDVPQKGGQRHVEFIHVADTGEEFRFNITLRRGVNAAAMLPTQAAQLVADAARQEVEKVETASAENRRAAILIKDLRVTDEQLAAIERVPIDAVAVLRKSLTILAQPK